MSGAQAREIRRRVSVNPGFQACGTGEVWTAPPDQSLGGSVPDRCEDLNVWVFAPAKPEGVAVPRHD